MQFYRLASVFLLSLLVSRAAEVRPARYALILEDPPLAASVQSRKDLARAATADRRLAIEAKQQQLRTALAQRHYVVTGSVQTLLNAVFVAAPAGSEQALGAFAGVRRAVRLPEIHPKLNRALGLMNVLQAWPLVGGEGSAGAGVKIGIIDTGIDQTHPAFQDPSLQTPSGFPKCLPDDCAYTTSKVIVARSYVNLLVLSGEADISRPDDLSPRDRVGHGTAVAAIAAGVRNSGPRATVTGVAPKAWLGNYKIFGSPGVNDVAFGDVVIAAIEDAFNDGMDIVTLSHGFSAVYGPLAADCGVNGNGPCDPTAETAQTAVERGMVVVAAAGNSGDQGIYFPAYSSIESPGTAPDVITVGASTNSHVWYQTLRVNGSNVPSNLQTVDAIFGDGVRPVSPLTAPLKTVASVGDNGFACTALPNGSMNGSIAVAMRGSCAFATKAINAQKAGAVALIIYQSDGDNSIFQPQNLQTTGIPVVMISNLAGQALRNYLASNPGASGALDPALREVDASSDTVADFSSRGPSIGLIDVKPELTAVGTDLYVPTQSYDPNSPLYSPDRYTVVNGTSFSVPMVAGAAALVIQRRPALNSLDVKSALVNSASSQIDEFFAGGTRGPAEVAATGAGKLDAAGAVGSTVFFDPTAISFGVLNAVTANSAASADPAHQAVPATRQLRISNRGASAVQLTITDSRGLIQSGSQSVAVNPGQTQVLNFTVSSLPSTGAYEGYLLITGGPVPLRVPYQFLVGDSSPANLLPLQGANFEGFPNEVLPGLLTAKVVDATGAPVVNQPVRFRALTGGGSIDAADANTDIYGIAAARIRLGSTIGEQAFAMDAGGLTVAFSGLSRLTPAITTNGIVNAASGRAGGQAPGSYISIFGRGLADITRVFSTPYLPLSLSGVSVSFDVPTRGLSLPGRLHFISDTQINVQVPWELEGLTSVLTKVSIGQLSSAVYTLPLAKALPDFFLIADPTNGTQIVAALDANNQLITAQNPARRGQVIQLFANALGPVTNRPASGEPSPSAALARTAADPTVLIGGQVAPFSFSGLTPFLVGLYQINVTVPAGAGTGMQDIQVRIQGVDSAIARIPVQ